jgi:hypothetical protein
MARTGAGTSLTVRNTTILGGAFQATAADGAAGIGYGRCNGGHQQG